MSAESTSTKLSLFFLRVLLSWFVGVALYFITLVLTSYDGLTTFISGIFGGAVISALGVLLCVLAGLLLMIPSVKHVWAGSLKPFFIFCALGFSLYAFSLFPSQIKIVGQDESGSAIKEVGLTWLPGCLIILFSVLHCPFFLKDKSDSTTT